MSIRSEFFCSGGLFYTVGQILGLFIMVIGFFVYYSKERSRILKVKLITDALSVIQQAMLGAFTGALLNCIAVFREIVFYNRFKNKWATHPIWLWIFVVLMGAAPIFTWKGMISVLPAVGSIFAVFGFYVKDPRHIRIIGAFTTILWLLYSVFTYNLGGILQNVVSLSSIVVALISDYVMCKRKRHETDGKANAEINE